MKKLLLSLILGTALFASACTRDEVVSALQDARWGLSAACSYGQEYITAEDCTITDTGLGIAIDVAKKAPPATIKVDVIDVLKGINTKLPLESPAKSFFDYVITFLSA